MHSKYTLAPIYSDMGGLVHGIVGLWIIVRNLCSAYVHGGQLSGARLGGSGKHPSKARCKVKYVAWCKGATC